MIAILKRRWCKLMHSKLFYPIHGKYLCSVCGEDFPAWKEGR